MDSTADEPVVAGTLQLSAEDHDFGSVQPNTTETATFEISNTGGNQGILLSYVMVTGSDEFAVDFPYRLPYVVGPGKSVTFEVSYTPKNNQTAEASLLIKEADRGDQQPKEIKLQGN